MPQPQINQRRHDIDWLRVIAIGLLLVYHIAIVFQPWGTMVGFMTNTQTWESLWIPMSMLNVWRIPLLFFISGMGVYFAMQNRNIQQLIKERSIRILIPFIFGVLVIVPIYVYLLQIYYNREKEYFPNPAHLWFLGNIFVYVLVLSPILFYLKKSTKIIRIIHKVFSSPLGFLAVLAVFILEVLITQPPIYELYVMTWHGFFLGIIAFGFGFSFAMCGTDFWEMLIKWKWVWIITAFALYIYRVLQPMMKVPDIQLVVESNLWIYSVLALGYQYLNKPSKVLNYLSQAVYPIYIIHMIFIGLGCLLILPLNITVYLKFVLIVLFVTAGCLGSYEFLIKRFMIFRFLFGLSIEKKEKVTKQEVYLEVK
ncbi:MAG: acyltransferase family protein [Raineya sp.]|jgi:hypothetical protein|nr:acyltransferase family protein [Raineya sp.]